MLTINQAVHVLERGGIIGVPLKTVYMEAVSAHNPIACERLFENLDTVLHEHSITHFFADIKSLQTVFELTHEQARLILTHPSTKNVSCILPFRKDNGYIPSSRGNRYGVCQIPNHPLALELINMLNHPLVGIYSVTKAGLYCTTSLTMEHFQHSIDGIIDGGSSLIGLLPTVVDCSKLDSISIISHGVVSQKTIEEVTSIKVQDIVYQPQNFDFHNHNRIPNIVDTIDELKQNCNQTSLLLAAQEDIEKLPQIALDCFILNLGSKNHPARVAQNLYNNLLQAQSENVEHIFYLRTHWGVSDIAQAITHTLNSIFDK